MTCPDLLFRVTKMDYRVNSTGYILSHFSDDRNNAYDPCSLSFCHHDDWELVARYFAFPHEENTICINNLFRLVSIKKENIEGLSYLPSFQFENGAFFGRIRQAQLTSDSLYKWERTKEHCPIPEWQLDGFPLLIETIGWKPSLIK